MMYACNNNIIQVIKSHSLTFIQANTYWGEFIEVGSAIFLKSLDNEQLTLI
jgi:hypothetical protein